jgi:AcrR family transcriptional regulator
MTTHEKQTEELIFETAQDVFTEKGFDGTRMEEISQRAGINKALLHYYYRTKEKLFTAIFEKVMGDFFSNMIEIMESEKPLFEKIEYFVENYINLILKNPHIPVFIINELNRNPQRLLSIFELTPIVKKNIIGKLEELIQKEIKKGTIRAIKTEELIINIISLCIFPIIAKPIITGIIFRGNANNYSSFIELRKKEVSKFIIDSIQIK